MSLFLNYVLPYRILNEKVDNWHGFIDDNFPYLKANKVMGVRGFLIEAELSDMVSGCSIIPNQNASEGKIVVLNDSSSVVKYSIDVPEDSRKVVRIKYSTDSNTGRIGLKLNNSLVGEVGLPATSSLNTLRNSKEIAELRLERGCNELSLYSIAGPIGLDCIQLSTIEQFDDDVVPDFSQAPCRIKNVGSGNYLWFDTVPPILHKEARLLPKKDTKTSGLLNLDFRGHVYWSISPFGCDSLNMCFEVKEFRLEENAPIGQYSFTNKNHKVWVILPDGDGYYRIMGKDSGLFLTSRLNDSGEECLVQSSYAGSDLQKWEIIPESRTTVKKTIFRYGTPESAALRVYDSYKYFDWFSFVGKYPPKTSSLLRGLTGNCRDEANYIVYMCRHLGIPAAIDYTPHWGNRSMAHSWSVIIRPDGTSIPFYMGHVPGDTLNYSHGYLKPKVFRHMFRLNEVMKNDLKHETEIPGMFQTLDFIDVTREYCETTDVTRAVPNELKNCNIAYICVYDNYDWVPVHYGKIIEGNVTFREMGRGIMYVTGIYKDGKVIPFGNPFMLRGDGEINEIKYDSSRLQDITLLRKHPFLGKYDGFNKRLSGGRFQVSNKADFSNSIDIHIHDGITEGNWYDVMIDECGLYRYFRYLGPESSYCNINEIELYSDEGKLLTGEIIGTSGESGKLKENVFDGDILTGFSAVKSSGQWVGLKFLHPVSIARLRYIGRNDGNCIEIGDRYELFCWIDNSWKSFGQRIASSNDLIYESIPSGGLYLLRNLSKGQEERIFSYVDNEQIWW